MHDHRCAVSARVDSLTTALGRAKIALARKLGYLKTHAAVVSKMQGPPGANGKDGKPGARGSTGYAGPRVRPLFLSVSVLQKMAIFYMVVSISMCASLWKAAIACDSKGPA